MPTDDPLPPDPTLAANAEAIKVTDGVRTAHVSTVAGLGALDVKIVAGGGGGGGGGTVDQGAPAADATTPWWMILSDGTQQIGTGTHPLRTDPTGATAQPVVGADADGDPSTANPVQIGVQDGNGNVSRVVLPIANYNLAGSPVTPISMIGVAIPASGGLVKGGGPDNPFQVDGQYGTFPVTAAALPLPTGAATETTLAAIKSTDGIKKIVDTVTIAGTVTANLGTIGTAATAANQALEITGLTSIAAALAPAATAAKQDTGNASLSSIDGKLPALSGGRVPVDPSGVTSPVSIAGTVAVSAAALPLPSGAATSALQTTGNTSLATIATNTTDAATNATLTGGTQIAQLKSGAKGATAAALVTSTAEGADHQALDVQLYSGGAAINPQTIRALTATDVVTAELSKWIGSTAPTVGSKASASSIPVVIASDQATFPVTVRALTNADVVTSEISKWIGSTAPTVGQKAMASSIPVVIASDQASIPVAATVSNAFALAATQTDGTQQSIIRGGVKGATTAATLTSTAEGADHQALDVQIYHGGTAKDPTQIRALTASDVVTANQGTPAAIANAWYTQVSDGSHAAAVANSEPAVTATDYALEVRQVGKAPSRLYNATNVPVDLLPSIVIPTNQSGFLMMGSGYEGGDGVDGSNRARIDSSGLQYNALTTPGYVGATTQRFAGLTEQNRLLTQPPLRPLLTEHWSGGYGEPFATDDRSARWNYITNANAAAAALGLPSAGFVLNGGTLEVNVGTGSGSYAGFSSKEKFNLRGDGFLDVSFWIGQVGSLSTTGNHVFFGLGSIVSPTGTGSGGAGCVSGIFFHLNAGTLSLYVTDTAGTVQIASGYNPVFPTNGSAPYYNVNRFRLRVWQDRIVFYYFSQEDQPNGTAITPSDYLSSTSYGFQWTDLQVCYLSTNQASADNSTGQTLRKIQLSESNADSFALADATYPNRRARVGADGALSVDAGVPLSDPDTLDPLFVDVVPIRSRQIERSLDTLTSQNAAIIQLLAQIAVFCDPTIPVAAVQQYPPSGLIGDGTSSQLADAATAQQ